MLPFGCGVSPNSKSDWESAGVFPDVPLKPKSLRAATASQGGRKVAISARGLRTMSGT